MDTDFIFDNQIIFTFQKKQIISLGQPLAVLWLFLRFYNDTSLMSNGSAGSSPAFLNDKFTLITRTTKFLLNQYKYKY